MNGKPFRKRPYTDIGIDGMKMALIAVTFLILAIWAALRFI